MSQIQKFSTGKALRSAVRQGQFKHQTAGQAPDHLQGNLVILPRQYARDFLVFCLNNPKPCPLIGLSRPGEPTLPGLGDIDIRTDVPRYRIYRDGELEREVHTLEPVWRDDLVTFVLGCSFTFEEALLKQGFQVRHIARGQNVPMFRTSIQTMPGGVFSGPLVVTMRSYPADQIPAVFDISAQYTHAHGAPVYWGDPAGIGIQDLQKPDYGDPIEVAQNETPVFWACGVTPQAALEKARPGFSITHAPGYMLVTDLDSSTKPAVNPMISEFVDSPALPGDRSAGTSP